MCNYSSSLTDSQSLLSLQNLTHNKAVAQALYIYKSTYYYLYKETSCDDLLITELSARIYQKITLKLLLRRLDICYIIYLDLWMVSWPQWPEQCGRHQQKQKSSSAFTWDQTQQRVLALSHLGHLLQFISIISIVTTDHSVLVISYLYQSHYHI